LQEPNLGKINHRVHPLYFFVDLFSPSFGLDYISNANPDLYCVLKFINFRFAYSPPSRRLSLSLSLSLVPEREPSSYDP
jgi:hypothetical protein